MAVWLIILLFGSGYAANKQGKKWWLILYSPFSVLIIFIVFFCWVIWGIPSLVTGKEKNWSKVRRY
jgi:NADH:ubiquinone oxidoreductase subunit 3 (subunit A)